MPTSDTLEKEYQLLSLIEQQPQLTQRQLASELGVSLGKTHYVLTALIERGLVKSGNFARSANKSGYAYVLTPKGIKEKVVITRAFLQRKMAEYDRITADIARLHQELGE
ncbi:MarR family EPS-associated transcriptional regulator [Gammaproteobacteria bacterium LSUCC0057]|uniref:MarR family EPS-associated transcriptional regulator n=1 Tax=Gammaproteobacteria bacterium LSUCC0057 TaxID=2559237 RepID=A0A4Y8UIS9_9GAMM|nr:MarR family EPS-associated transcriptional regulator [Gammaproteobacteria bacterium LSUCC0057]